MLLGSEVAARQLWMVRIPRGRIFEVDARGGLVAISAGMSGDLSDIVELEDAISLIEAENPSLTIRQVESRARAVVDLSMSILAGDLLLVHLRDSRSVVIAIARPRRTVGAQGLPAREIEVIREFPEASLPADLTSSLSAQQAVCQLRHPNAVPRIAQLLAQGPVALPELPDPGSALGGHEMAQLVAAALQADGFRCHLSPQGPDGGADILAGKGILGFDGGLVVQVKSGRIVCGTAEIDRLMGVMQARGAAYGMIASWGGFTKPAMARVPDLWFKVRLWNRGDIAEAAGKAAPHLDGPMARVADEMAAWHRGEEAEAVEEEAEGHREELLLPA